MGHDKQLLSTAKNDFELSLQNSCSKYESIGDFIYFNYHDEHLISRILETAQTEIESIILRRTPRKSYIIYLALVIIQMRYYAGSFWEPVRNHFKEYDNYLSTQTVDGFFRKIIDFTHKNEILEITRQSTKVQYDSIMSFNFIHTLYEICFDYYHIDLECGKTETDFFDEANFLLDGLKHKFSQDSFEDDTVTISSKVYNLIKSTRLRIKYSQDSVLDLLIEILKMIDSYFWESEEYNGNHYLHNNFMVWASYMDDKLYRNDLRIYGSKENTEHIIRKPNLYIYRSDIYFKIPTQKLKDYDLNSKVYLDIEHDDECTTFIPSVTTQLIGYSLEGKKVIVLNPFTALGYKIYDDKSDITINYLEKVDFYIFDANSGRRLTSLDNMIGDIVLITKKQSSVTSSYVQFISEYSKDEYHVRLLKVNQNSILNIDNYIISSFNKNQSGILIDYNPYVTVYHNDTNLHITRKKPIVVLPIDYRNKRTSLFLNETHYPPEKFNEISGEYISFDFNNIDFIRGVNTVKVIDLTSRKLIYRRVFYYDSEFEISLNKEIYYSDEIPVIYTRFFDRSNKIEYIKGQNVYNFGDKILKIKVPYVDYSIIGYDGKKTDVFLEDLPREIKLLTSNINSISINSVEFEKNSSGNKNIFDISSIHNFDINQRVVKIKANTRRGSVYLFSIYLTEYIDMKKSHIKYCPDNERIEGELYYIGKRIPIIHLQSAENEIEYELKDNGFSIPFPGSQKLNMYVYTKVKDDFGILDKEKNILYEKEFKFIDVKKMIGKYLISSSKITGKNKTLMETSKFNIEITNHLEGNDFSGEAFFVSYYGSRRTFPKYSPIRIEFMTNNYNTRDDDIRIYLNDSEEIFGDYDWLLKEGEK